jgi:hypothetical protein
VIRPARRTEREHAWTAWVAPATATALFLAVGSIVLGGSFGWVVAAAAAAWASTAASEVAMRAMPAVKMWHATLGGLVLYIVVGAAVVVLVGPTPGASRAFTVGQLLFVLLVTRTNLLRAQPAHRHRDQPALWAIGLVVSLPSVVFGALSQEAPLRFQMSVYAGLPLSLGGTDSPAYTQTPLGADAILRATHSDGSFDEWLAPGGVASGSVPYGSDPVEIAIYFTLLCLPNDESDSEGMFYLDSSRLRNEQGVLRAGFRETALRIALGSAYDPASDPGVQPREVSRRFSLQNADARATKDLERPATCVPVSNTVER